MSPVGHLYLDEFCLAPSTEWEVPFTGWCFAHIARGQGYWLGRPPQAVNTGDMVVLFPQRKGVFRASQLGEMRLVYFRFCPEFLMGFLTPSERHGLETLAEDSSRGARYFTADQAVAVRLAETAATAAGTSSLQLRCQLLQIIGLAFAKELNSSGVVSSGALFAGSRIRQLMNHLTEAELLAASGPVLAQRCGCSVRHFNRLFLQTFGESFRSKQTELRLTQARRLLSETTLPVKEIARTAGFKHLGIFYARFKKLFAMTPVECRQGRIISTVPSTEGTPSCSPAFGDSIQAAS